MMNFYQKVNKEWESKTKIPDDQSKWGGFVELQHKSRQDLLKCFINPDEATKNTLPFQLYEYYLKQRNISISVPIELEQIDIIEAHRRGIDTILHIDKTNDPDNPDIVVMDITPTGLSLPHDHYTNESKMKQFHDHLITIANKYKINPTWATDVLEFEKKLASHLMTPTQSRRFTEYITRIEKTSMTPRVIRSLKSLPEKETFIDLGTGQLHLFLGMILPIMSDVVIIYDGDGFRACISMLEDKRFDSYMNYKKFQSMPEFEVDMFEFYGKQLGIIKPKTPEENAVDFVNKIVPEQLGQLYASKYFKTQKTIDDMIPVITESYIQTILESDFTTTTKLRAIKKILNMKLKIGAPSIKLITEPFLSIENIHMCNFAKLINQYGKPSSDEWALHPHIVNARSVWSRNEIIFPAAILQPPMFYENIDQIEFLTKEYLGTDVLPMIQKNRDDLLFAANMGAMGCIIAHEMTHALDDRGRNYDENCKMSDWMTPSDIEVFRVGKEIIRKQIEQFNETSSYKINADLVMTEVMADIGGLQIAFRAFRSVGNRTKAIVFFVSYATALRIKIRPEVFERELKGNPHAPAEFRANLIDNIDEFKRYGKISSNKYLIWKTLSDQSEN